MCDRGGADHQRQPGRVVREFDDRILFVQLKLIGLATDRHSAAREVRGPGQHLYPRPARLQPVRLVHRRARDLHVSHHTGAHLETRTTVTYRARGGGVVERGIRAAFA